MKKKTDYTPLIQKELHELIDKHYDNELEKARLELKETELQIENHRELALALIYKRKPKL